MCLSCTDLNTKFFHASTVYRRRYNSISSLKMLDGYRLCGRDNIGNFLVHHFQTLFITSNPCFDKGISDLVGEVITIEESANVCLIPGEAKIFVAL